MRRSLGILALTGIVAVAVAQVSGSGLLSTFAKSLNDAKSLSTTYTVQVVNGTSSQYKVELKKPNLARIETPDQLIVADGKQITTFDKKAQTYFKAPQNEAELKAIFSADELNIWAGFFNTEAYKAIATKELGKRNRNGQSLNGVEATYDAQGRKVVTYFLNSDDNVARQGVIELDRNDPSKKLTTILNTKSLTINGASASDLFAFSAPDGSREITLAEMTAAKWFTDLEEAKKMANATGKKIFVDFMASWCGPCKMLERDCFHTDQFKELAAKNFVLLKVDVDEQKSIAKMYNIEAMPTQLVLDKTGAVLATRVGYSNPQDFFAFLKGAIGQ